MELDVENGKWKMDFAFSTDEVFYCFDFSNACNYPFTFPFR